MISKKFFRMVRKRLHLQEKLYAIEFAWMHAFIFLVFSCWQNFLEKTMILSMRKQHNMLGFWLMKWNLFVLLWRIFVHCTNQTWFSRLSPFCTRGFVHIEMYAHRTHTTNTQNSTTSWRKNTTYEYHIQHCTCFDYKCTLLSFCTSTNYVCTSAVNCLILMEGFLYASSKRKWFKFTHPPTHTSTIAYMCTVAWVRRTNDKKKKK